jgi:hypothetical protein
VDLSRGVAVGSTEQVAQGGADVASAHAAPGLADNPAAVAPRAPGGWDWDGDLGSFVVGGRDFDNNGSASTAYRRQMVTHLGGLVRRGVWGAGVYGLTQQYDVETAGVVRRFQFSTTHLVVGRSCLEGRLLWGLGMRFAEFKATSKGQSQTLLHLSGAGFSAGLQWASRWDGLRFGAAYQGPIQDDPHRSLSGGGSTAVDGLIVPKGVDLPAVLSGGMSYVTGRWTGAADLVMVRRVEEANGIESFLEQRVQRSGRRATVSPRFGLQEEPWTGRLRLRAGTYFEPSRFEEASGRWHGTGGFEVRVFKIRLFGERWVSLSYALDAAPRYVANFLSIGFWH